VKNILINIWCFNINWCSFSTPAYIFMCLFQFALEYADISFLQAYLEQKHSLERWIILTIYCLIYYPTPEGYHYRITQVSPPPTSSEDMYYQVPIFYTSWSWRSNPLPTKVKINHYPPSSYIICLKDWLSSFVVLLFLTCSLSQNSFKSKTGLVLQSA